jgi:hypothetical protein
VRLQSPQYANGEDTAFADLARENSVRQTAQDQQFKVQGQVAMSTHAGIPWLRYIRHPPSCSVVAEVYPALWSRNFPTEKRTPDQQDALAMWFQKADYAHAAMDLVEASQAPRDSITVPPPTHARTKRGKNYAPRLASKSRENHPKPLERLVRLPCKMGMYRRAGPRADFTPSLT